jgi:branched-chain amino acid transport system substrate-binding protein
LPVASSISEVSKVYPWAVVFIPSMDYMYRSTLDWYKLKPNIKSIVIFKDTKNPVWREAGDLVKKFSEEVGVKVLDIIDVDAGSVDVSAPAVRGMAKKPDGYFLSTEATQTARIILELQDRGWKVNDAISCHNAIASPTLLEVGSGRLDGVYFIGMPYNYDLPNPRWQSFIKDFGAAHGEGKPAMYVPPYFDAPYAIKEAIEKTGVTGDPAKIAEERVKIRDYIRSMKGFEGVYTTYDMSEEGWAILPGSLAQVRENKIVFVGQ